MRPTITVSPLTRGDGPELLEFERANREFFREHIGDRGDAYFAEYDERHVALVNANESNEALMCVVRDVTGIVVGRVNLQDIAPDGEVGYRIAASASGRGYATEAVRQLIEQAGPLGIATLSAASFTHNLASRRVLKANGFKEVHDAEPIPAELNGVYHPVIHFRRDLLQ